MHGALMDSMTRSPLVTPPGRQKSHTSNAINQQPSRAVPFWVDVAIPVLLALSLAGFTLGLFMIYLVDEYGFPLFH